MWLPYFISKRYLLSKKDTKLLNLISVIAIIGITLGVATLIIAISILRGFEKTLTTKIIDFDSHIQIVTGESFFPFKDYNISNISEIVGDNKAIINPMLSKLAVISSKKFKEGINIRGITFNNNYQSIQQNIVEGKFNILDNNSIVIGKRLADKLFVKVGDRVTIFALKKDQMPSLENMPNIKQYYVKGIFESGMSEYDDTYAYVNLQSSQDLFDMEGNINQIDIKLNKIDNIQALTDTLDKELPHPYRAVSIYQTHKSIFTWIELQKKPIPILLGLIIIVAIFNIISTILMIVLEKTSAIGILKSLGAKKSQLLSLFLIQGSYISLIGIVLGNILAFILTFLQLHYKIISLPSSVYFMSSIPIELSLDTFVLISLIAFLLSLIASILPAYVATKIKTISALRFN